VPPSLRLHPDARLALARKTETVAILRPKFLVPRIKSEMRSEDENHELYLYLIKYKKKKNQHSALQNLMLATVIIRKYLTCLQAISAVRNFHLKIITAA
jgi:hypothetical protein